MVASRATRLPDCRGTLTIWDTAFNLYSCLCGLSPQRLWCQRRKGMEREEEREPRSPPKFPGSFPTWRPSRKDGRGEDLC